MIVQQLSGINAVIFYAGDILGSAGIKDRDFGGLIVMIVQFLVTGISCCLVDKLGRRTLLLLSLASMTLAATLMGLYFALGAPSPIALVALIIYISGFSIGLGPVPWLLMSELLPKRSRAVASAAATMLNWAGAFIVTESYDYVVIALRPSGAFFLFTAVIAFGFLYVSSALPETKGLSLNAIEDLFTNRLHSGAAASSSSRP